MKIFKKVFFSAVAVGATTIALASCANAKNDDGVTIIYAETKGAPAPFIYQDEQGNLDGYDIAVINEVFDRLPQYKLDLQVSDSALVDAQTGTIDFTINNWSYNSSRAETYYFSYPYTRAKYAFVSGDGVAYSSFSQVAEAGKKVFGSQGNNATNAIERWNEANPSKQIEIEYTGIDITAKIPYYLSGEYVELGDIPVLNAWAKEYPDTYGTLKQTILSDEETKLITTSATSHLLFGKAAKNSVKLRQEISNVIKELHDDGTLTRLSIQYAGVDLAPSDSDYVYLN